MLPEQQARGDNRKFLSALRPHFRHPPCEVDFVNRMTLPRGWRGSEKYGGGIRPVYFDVRFSIPGKQMLRPTLRAAQKKNKSRCLGQARTLILRQHTASCTGITPQYIQFVGRYPTYQAKTETVVIPIRCSQSDELDLAVGNPIEQGAPPLRAHTCKIGFECEPLTTIYVRVVLQKQKIGTQRCAARGGGGAPCSIGLCPQLCQAHPDESIE